MQTVQFELPEQLKVDMAFLISELKDLKNSFQPKAPTEYLTRQETADLLKVDLSTIHNYTKRKIIQSYGISGRVYYKRSEIENAIVKLIK